MDPLSPAVSPHWSALIDATLKLARARSLGEVIDIVRTAAREVTGADGISFVTCDGEHCHYIAEDAITPLWLGQRFRMEECVSGQAILTWQAIAIPDIYVDPRVPHEAYRSTFVKSLVMIPLNAPPFAGAMGAYWSAVDGFDDAALELFTSLAQHVGAAISNVARQDALAILNRTGATVSAERDLKQIVQIVVDAGVELTGAEFGAFFYNQTDGQGERYMLYALSGVPDEAFSRFPMPRNTPLFAPTFGGVGPVRSDDIRLDPRYGRNAPRNGMPEGHLPVASYLAVPVVSRTGEVHGGLFFGHHRAARFTGEHEDMLVGIAGHAAIAIDNARLNQAAQSEIAARRHAEGALRELNATLEARIDERTAQIQAAFDRLEESERRFRILVDGVVDYAICMIDPEGIVSNWNVGAQRIKGYPASEIIGQHFSVFYTEEDRRAGRPQLTLDTATRAGKVEFEGWRVRKNGERFWASVLLDAIRDESGKLLGFAKVTRDLTERRQVEEQLRQSQKMEAVGQLTGGIAHDFNNLLQGVTGNLQLIERRLDQGRTDALDRYIHAAMASANRASSLTHRLLAFSRRQPLDPRPVRVNPLIESMADLLRQTLGETITLDLQLQDGLFLTKCDPNQLESAILNLAINARDAMPDGGRLTISTGSTRFSVPGAAGGDGSGGRDYVRISVADTGVGMDADVISRAFEPFFTTKPLGQGTGLGLSMVYGFARQSEGHARIESEAGRGTTISLDLPRHDEAEPQEDAACAVAAPASAAEPGRGTVLVVEDEPLVRQLVTEVLADLGYRTVEAADGPEGLEILHSSQPLDLLITDIGLPGLNGRQLADAGRVARPDLKILFMTGYAENAAMPSGFLQQGMKMITKPFDITAMASRIREILAAP